MDFFILLCIEKALQIRFCEVFFPLSNSHQTDILRSATNLMALNKMH